MINSFTHFRALAIIMIVAGHSFTIGKIEIDGFFEGVIANIIIGGTSLFVFISGFFFKEVFADRYNYKRFIKGKLLNVGRPYLILSTIPIIYYIFKKPDNITLLIDLEKDYAISKTISETINYLITGQVLVAYWYVPFILIMFLLSPLHMAFISLNTKQKIIITAFFYITAIFLHRPIDNINPIQSIIYFTPIYFIGILASEHKKLIYKKLNNKKLAMLSIIILLSTLQTYLDKTGNYHNLFILSNEVDLMLIQKTIMCILLMVTLNNLENIKTKTGDILAKTSFTIFFIHPLLITIMVSLNIVTSKESWPIYIAAVGLIVMLSTCIALVSKLILKEKSRIFIGY